MIDWHSATLEEIGALLEATAERQHATFPAPTAAAYAAEQRGPDPDDDTQDYG